ncbi:septal ring lytic transglycosylase RlpA family protein [Phenylobacterium hankyongense]|nr:septal ring lytic transglycosylase RlpA family protein [Phenylobacterium hankyongense]
MGSTAAAAAEARAPPQRPEVAAKPQTGKASYYGTHDAGEKTASGARFAPDKMTAASPTLPLGTKAKVTNAETGKSVHVTVTDRGPYAKNRILDVTPKAAKQLGMKESGVSTVKVQPLHVPRSSH